MTPEELKASMQYPGWARQLAGALRPLVEGGMWAMVGREEADQLSYAAHILDAFDRWENNGLDRLIEAIEQLEDDDHDVGCQRCSPAPPPQPERRFHLRWLT